MATRTRQGAAELWRELFSGRFVVESCHDARGARHIRIAEIAGELSPRRRLVLLYRAYDLTFAEIGHELGMTPAGVAWHLSAALEALGLRSDLDLALLVGVALRPSTGPRRAGRRPSLGDIRRWVHGEPLRIPRGLRVRRAPGRRRRRWALSYPVSMARFRDRLTIAEIGVVEVAVTGSSYAEIGKLRGTDGRTVANQLSSATGKLGVRSRYELALLVRSGRRW